MSNREYITRHCIPDLEVPFSREEWRRARIRGSMDARGVDTLFVSAPEGLYHVSGFIVFVFTIGSHYREAPPNLGPTIFVGLDDVAGALSVW